MKILHRVSINGDLSVLRLICISILLSSGLGILAEKQTATLAQETKVIQVESQSSAEKVFDEGKSLEEKGTPASLRDSISKFEEALGLWRKIGNQYKEADTLHYLGRSYQALTETKQALNYYNQALVIWKAIGYLGGQAKSLNNLGLVFKDLKDSKKALEYFNQALYLWDKANDQNGKSKALSNIAGVYIDSGDKNRGIEFLKQALLASKVSQNREQEVGLLYNIGLAYWGLDNKKSLEFYTQTLELSRELGDRNKEAIVLHDIGFLYGYFLNNKQNAIKFLSESLSAARVAKNKSQEAKSLQLIGSIYVDLKDQKKSIEFYIQAAALNRELGDRDTEALNLSNIGRAYSNLNDKQNALKFLNEALSKARIAKNKINEAESLELIGFSYDNLGDKKKSFEFYIQAVTLYHELGNQIEEIGILARIIKNVGSTYSNLNEKQNAIKFLNESLPKARVAKNKRFEASSLYFIGYVYDNLGERKKAIEFYTQAVALHRELGNRTEEARILNIVGRTYSNLNDKQNSLKFLNEALSAAKIAKNKIYEAESLQLIGIVYDNSGEKKKSLEFYTQAVVVYREISNRTEEARTLNNIGSVYDDLNDKQNALKFLSEAQLISRAAKNKNQESRSIQLIGIVYDNSGEKKKSLEFYKQAITLYREIGDRDGEARNLNNIGSTLNDIGENQKALETLNQALELAKSLNNRNQEIKSNQYIARTYFSIQEYDKAILSMERAVKISKEIGDKTNEAATLSFLSLTHVLNGEPRKAIQYLEKVQPLLNPEDEARYADFYAFKGLIYVFLGNHQQATKSLSQALEVSRKVGNRQQEASILYFLAYSSDLDDRSNDLESLKYLEQALPIFHQIKSDDFEAYTLLAISDFYIRLKRNEQALSLLKEASLIFEKNKNELGKAAVISLETFLDRNFNSSNEKLSSIEKMIDLIEFTRGKMVDLQSKTTLLSESQYLYKLHTDLLMALNVQQPDRDYAERAFQSAEKSRARSLLDSLSEDRNELRKGADKNLLEQEQKLLDRISVQNIFGFGVFNSMNIKSSLLSTGEGNQNLISQIQELQTKIRLSSPNYSALVQAQPLNIREVQQQVLDSNTLLLEYSLGQDQSYLWAVTPTSFTSYILPGAEVIENAAKHLQNLLSNPAAKAIEISEASNKLSQILLDPVAAQLGSKRLLIVGDGALQSLPFSVLNNPNAPQQPLLTNHEIVASPSASVIAVLRREHQTRKLAPQQIAIFADPVFTLNSGKVASSGRTSTEEERTFSVTLKKTLRDSGISLTPLPGSRREAEKIISLVSPSTAQLKTGFDANRLNATAPDLSQYRIIHFATHGILNSTNPELSGLVLSLFDKNGKPQDGFLKLIDIYNLNLPAELVVLSACQTGLGKNIRGEGLVGLTRGFMYAGAKSVLVSQWKVNDESTAELMSLFYTKLLKEKMPPAAALRAAQLELRQNPKWQSPYYWAAFTLQGEWK
jgi:CHAT domain-containing protein/Tfp pilus assembly protein PilF